MRTLVAGYDDASALRASGIMVAGKKYMYLRNDEEMMVGKAGQGGICIFKTGQALIMGSYNQDMAAAMNTKEVGKMAVRVPTCPAVQTDLAANFTDLDSCPPVPLFFVACVVLFTGLPEGGRLLDIAPKFRNLHVCQEGT